MMILKAGLIFGTLLFGIILGYWGYFVKHYTFVPEDNND